MNDIRKLLDDSKVYDEVLINMVEKGMKQIYINHARKCGASEEWLEFVKDLGSISLAIAVGVLYGDPTDSSPKEESK